MANEMWLVSAKDVDFYAAQHFSFDIYTAVTTAVRGVPRVDARPVVHGEWIEGRKGRYICSVCQGEAGLHGGGIGQNLSNYCPNCGSQMDGGDGDG